MDSIFEIIFNLFLTLWNNIANLIEPIIRFIQSAAQTLIPLLTRFINWVLGAIEDIINFFKNLFKWGDDGFGVGSGGGAGGGGGRPRIFLDMFLMAKEVVTKWTLL